MQGYLKMWGRATGLPPVFDVHNILVKYFAIYSHSD